MKTRPSAVLGHLPSWLLAHLAQTARAEVGAALDGLGTSRPEFAILTAVEEYGPVHQSGVAEISGQDAGDTTRVLNALEARGWIAREDDPDDRRRKLVTLTAQGRTTQALLHGAVVEANARALALLSQEEQQQLVEILRTATGIARQRS